MGLPRAWDFCESVHWMLRMRTPPKMQRLWDGVEGQEQGYTGNKGEQAWNPGHQLPASAPHCILRKAGAWPLGPDYFLRTGRGHGKSPRITPLRSCPNRKCQAVPPPTPQGRGKALPAIQCFQLWPSLTGDLDPNRACVTLDKVLPLSGPQSPPL